MLFVRFGFRCNSSLCCESCVEGFVLGRYLMHTVDLMETMSRVRGIPIRRQAELARAEWASEDNRRTGLRERIRVARAFL
jgi:hypothetical protein